MSDLEKEVWKDCVYFKVSKNEWIDYTGYYQASSKGSIRSLNFRHIPGKIHNIKPFKMHKNENRYLGVNLWKEGTMSMNLPVHQLIAFAFPEICGEYFEGAVINHLDENPENNAAENLRWVSVAENNAWGTARDRQLETRIRNGGCLPGCPYGKNASKEEKNKYIREYSRKYRDKNRDKINAYYRKRYRKKKMEKI